MIMLRTRQILANIIMNPQNTENSDKSLHLAALLDKMCSSPDLDKEILLFLSLLSEIFDLQKSFLAFHGGDSLIIKTNKLIELEQEEAILNAINKAQKIKIKNLEIIPIKILNQNLAGLGIMPTRTLSQHDYHKLDIYSSLLSTAIKQNQIFNDLKTNNEKLLINDKQKTELISTVSHELRTPMANIMGFTELLLNKEFDSTITKTYLKEIHESSLRLANLISNFLDLSRLEMNGILQFNNREEVELDWLAERAWQQLASLNKQHKLIIEKDSKLRTANVDSDAFIRVFINLFSNAIKYSFDQKDICCKFNQHEDHIEIAVIDQGIGIQEEYLESVFEKFFRVNCQKTKYINGTGLGLWITKEIIESHNGKIWAEKNNNQGTSVIFTLPSLKTP